MWIHTLFLFHCVINPFLLSSLSFSRVSPSEPDDHGCHGDEEQQTDPEDSPCDTEGETPLIQTEQHIQQSQTDTQVSGRHAHTHTHCDQWLCVCVCVCSIFPIANLLPVSVCRIIPNVWCYRHSRPSFLFSDCVSSWNSTGKHSRDDNRSIVMEFN